MEVGVISQGWFFGILTLMLILLIIFIRNLYHFQARLFLLTFSLFYYIYNGVGLAYNEISLTLRIYFFIFYIIFCVVFILFFRIKSKLLNKVEYKIKGIEIKPKTIVKAFAFIYILTVILPLFYPTLIIGRLINPPTPDLLGNLNDFQIVNAPSQTFMKLAFYVQTLCLPFFIYFFDVTVRKNKIVLYLLNAIILSYVAYVQSAYISRSDILLIFQIALLVFFIVQRKISSKHLFAISIPILLIIIFFSAYQEIRLGKDSISSNSVNMLLTNAFETEISFPKNVVQKIVDKGFTTDLSNYFLWLTTLPIPKIFISNHNNFELNKELSQLLLGISSEDQYFFILLPGILGEGIYIYGGLFFLHAIFLGFIFGVFLRLFRTNIHFNFFIAYLMVLMSYYTCRGGIVSSLPILINGNLLFFFYLFFLSKLKLKK